jgi:hypothetical protein
MADIGLLRVDTQSIRKVIVNEPDNKLKIFQEFIPEMLKTRNKEIKDWMSNQSNLLKGNAPNIEEFVQKSNILKETIKLLPRYKRKFANLDHIRTILI